MDSLDKYVGIKYKLKSSTQLEEYLTYIGVGMILRKAASAVTPVIILSKNEDGSYTYTITTAFKTMAFTFKIGEEFIEERPDGVKMKCIMSVEGDTLKQIQLGDCDKKSIHLRTFTADSLTVVSTAEGWDGECVRVYEAVK